MFFYILSVHCSKLIIFLCCLLCSYLAFTPSILVLFIGDLLYVSHELSSFDLNVICYIRHFRRFLTASFAAVNRSIGYVSHQCHSSFIVVLLLASDTECLIYMIHQF